MSANDTRAEEVADAQTADQAAQGGVDDQIKYKTQDPFTNQRADADKVAPQKMDGPPDGQEDKHKSDEWDASKTTPSKFQKRKGSILATPGSRDGHVDKHVDRDAAFHATHAEKGYGGKRGSNSSKGD
ncbi:hypothetical protein B7494_g6236 [Chlorociboria aeruginascens]|nr:hypothetical protein B7494_g6236 [Chlorociboria aeruginascens]